LETVVRKKVRDISSLYLSALFPKLTQLEIPVNDVLREVLGQLATFERVPNPRSFYIRVDARFEIILTEYEIMGVSCGRLAFHFTLKSIFDFL
jgi:hypothetical protein